MTTTYTGGPGVTFPGDADQDIYSGTAASLNTDTIQNLKIGDIIRITDLTAATANLGISGNTITYGNNLSITVQNLGPGRLIPRDLPTGGVDIKLQENAHNDFNGDGHSDVLWRDDNGNISEWLSTNNGGFTAGAGSSVGPDWHVVGTGDFNGDGRDDVLWRNDDGTLTEWLSQPGSGWVDNGATVKGFVATSWQVTGMADFNGDGRMDVLWRDSNGTVSEWLANANGSFTAGAGASVGTDWHIQGTGDFNGDGKGDVLWRNDDGTLTEWLGQPNGSWVDNGANLKGVVATSWHIVGIGDMNGDSRADILWRADDGTVSEWLANTNGSFTSGAGASVGPDWHIITIGDFNGDGIDDVLWRNDNGNLTEWLGQTNGGWVDNSVHASGALSNSWHIQDPFF